MTHAAAERAADAQDKKGAEAFASALLDTQQSLKIT